MQSFTDEVRAEARWKTRTPCSVGVFINTLPDGEAADVREAFADETVTAMAIGRVLARRYEVNFSDTTLGRHRRGVTGGNGCRCG